MPLPSTYLAIDGTERHIVGINPSSAAAMRDGILSRIFPKVLGIPTNVTHGAGFTPNIESILSLKPDVVFQWATIGSDPIEALDRVGLKVLGIRTGTQSDTDAYVAMVGQVAGKDARASRAHPAPTTTPGRDQVRDRGPATTATASRALSCAPLGLPERERPGHL